MAEMAEVGRPALVQGQENDDGTDAARSSGHEPTGRHRDWELRSVWDGLRLETYAWAPKRAPPRLILYLCHGAGEHMGRYEKLKNVLVESGILVYGHDHVGNGRSEGTAMHVNSFDTYVLDVIQHVEGMKAQYPDVPSLIMGHSMGGLITLHVVLRKPELFCGFVLSSPLVEIDPSTGGPVLQFLAKVVGAIVPQAALGKPINPEFISTIPEEVQEYRDDPLIYRGSIRARWGAEVVEAIKTLHQRVGLIRLPMFIMHSRADRLTPYTGSTFVLDKISSEDKTFEWFEDLYHELLHDKEQEKARTLIRDWLLNHAAPPTLPSGAGEPEQQHEE